MRRTIAVLAALALMLVVGAPAGARGGRTEGSGPEQGQRHPRPAARVQRFPRPSRAQHAWLDPDGLLRRELDEHRVDTDDGARRRRRVLRLVHQGSARAEQNTVTVGAGDLIGASPLISGLFHDEPTIHAMNAIGARRVGCREPRVRRGDRRAPAHAVRRLRRRRHLPARTVSRRVLPVSRGERVLRGDGPDDPAALRDQEDRQREDRVHRPHARGDADDRDALRCSRP